MRGPSAKLATEHESSSCRAFGPCLVSCYPGLLLQGVFVTSHAEEHVYVLLIVAVLVVALLARVKLPTICTPECAPSNGKVLFSQACLYNLK